MSNVDDVMSKFRERFQKKEKEHGDLQSGLPIFANFPEIFETTTE